MKCRRAVFESNLVGFVQKCRTVTRLHIKMVEVRDEEFEQIATELSDLVELSADIGSNFSIHMISGKSVERMLKDHKNLMHFSISYEYLDVSTFQMDLKEIESDWKIEYGEKGISFQRKEQ